MSFEVDNIKLITKLGSKTVVEVNLNAFFIQKCFKNSENVFIIKSKHFTRNVKTIDTLVNV